MNKTTDLGKLPHGRFVTKQSWNVASCSGSILGLLVGARRKRARACESTAEWPLLLTADEAAVVLRTTRKAVYAMAARGALPGVKRLGRRFFVSRDDLVHFIGQKSAPSNGDRR